MTYNAGMVSLNAHFDGKAIIPDQPTGLAAGTRLRVTLEPIDQPVSPPSGRLELPLLTGIDREVVQAILEGSEFDIESAQLEQFLRPIISEQSR